jgi:hypothetical protein
MHIIVSPANNCNFKSRTLSIVHVYEIFWEGGGWKFLDFKFVMKAFLKIKFYNSWWIFLFFEDSLTLKLHG